MHAPWHGDGADDLGFRVDGFGLSFQGVGKASVCRFSVRMKVHLPVLPLACWGGLFATCMESPGRYYDIVVKCSVK